MLHRFQNLIIGQGLAGSAIAWHLHWAGQSVCVVDGGHPDSASRVAAGLLTPITGKRLVRSPDYDEDWQFAEAFYRRVEQETQTAFFKSVPMLRLFPDDESRHAFLQRSGDLCGVACWDGTLQPNQACHAGICMSPAGRLNVHQYLQATEQMLNAHHMRLQATLDISRQVTFSDHVTCRISEDTVIQADRMILCLGAASRFQSLCADIPNNPCRGDILNVRISDYQRSEVVHRSVWIAPEPDGTQTVGATYDWHRATPEISADGRRELLQSLSRLVTGDVTVIHHKAGVRPSMKDYEPVVGSHPDHPQVYLLNGLGSKGTLKAPRMADLLCRSICSGTEIPERLQYGRLVRPVAESRPLTRQAQDAVRTVLQPGDTAIDATVGNGFDTAFLAEITGASGRVIGFDVQPQAIHATQQRITAAGFSHVELKLGSHEHMNDTAEPESVQAIMFNLGFLPRSDRTVVTRPESSVQAIRHAVRLLADSGILTVLAYRGHTGGEEEFQEVSKLLQNDLSGIDVQQVNSRPAKPESPVLFLVRKTEKHPI
ncbi:MAG: FAD-dependent oxidoreductase [Planctomycetaceae bacterium]